MKLKYINQDDLTFIGFYTKIKLNEGYQKCPEFWEKEYSLRFAHLWQTMKPENAIEQAVFDNDIGTFAICEDHEQSFDYWIAGLYLGGEVPEGLHLYTIKASKWAIFKTKGPLPSSLQQLNDYIIKEWFEKEGKALGARLNLMLEKYSTGDSSSPEYESEIWVPLR